MKVFVAGGTGAIGGQAVAALVRAGHQVTAIARSPEKSALLRRQGAAPIAVSIFDQAALVEAFRGHDAVINLATAIPSTSRFLLTRAWAENSPVRQTLGISTTVAASVKRQRRAPGEEREIAAARRSGARRRLRPCVGDP